MNRIVSRLLKTGVLLVVLLFGLLLYVKNSQPVEIDLYVFSLTLPAAVLLLLALLGGVLLGVLVCLPLMSRMKYDNWRLRRAARRDADDSSSSLPPPGSA